MRKHISAAHARARAARTCLGIITGSLVVIGLTACGGGDSTTAQNNQPAQPQNVSDASAQAQAISTPALGTTIQGTDWSAALPELPPRVFLMPASTSGTTYYIDARAAYTSADMPPAAELGKTPSTPFTSITDFINRVGLSNLKSGDAILLKCGAVFRSQSLTLTGRTGIYIGPYQPGVVGPSDCVGSNLPTLRQAKWGGKTTQAIGLNWTATSEGSPVYEAPTASVITRMFLYTAPLVKARHPNASDEHTYLLADSGVNSTQFKVSAADKQQFDTHGVVGADIYIKSRAWIVERRKVVDYQDGVITLNRGLAMGNVPAGAGYYLAGKSWMLDQAGEWYQDTSNNKVYYWVKNSSDLASLEYTDNSRTLDNDESNGISIRKSSNIRISRIAFEHQEMAALGIYSSSNVTVSGVDVRFASEVGIDVGLNTLTDEPSNHVTVEQSKVRGVWGVGIRAGGMARASNADPAYPVSKNVAVRNNLVFETAMHDAAPKEPDANGMAAIRLGGPPPPPNEESPPAAASLDAQAIGNIVLNNAGPGIVLDNGRHGGLIEGNTVINACLRTSDCGGIYANNRDEARALPAAEGTTSAIIRNNMVTGVPGDIEGVPATIRTKREQTFGIYLDDLSANIEVVGNQISHAAGGIYLHNASWNNVHHNTIKSVTLASIMVSSDWSYSQPAGGFIETVRGNVMQDNVLFSHRPVDANKFQPTWDIQAGAQDQGRAIYAQYWLHKYALPTTFFTDDTGTGARRNTSLNNDVITHGGENTWRMDQPGYSNNASFPALTTKVSGGIWFIQKISTPDYGKRMALPDWLSLVGATPGTQDKDVSSPVVYRPYVLTLGAPLIAPLGSTSGWTWNETSPVSYIQDTTACGGAALCAQVLASEPWHALRSPIFPTVNGTLYFVKYKVKQGPVRGEHTTSALRDSTPNRYAQVGAYLQSVYTEANEFRHFEHFFRGNTYSDTNTRLYLKPSDGVMTDPSKQYTTQYFSDVSIHPVTAVTVLPPLNQISATAANASSADRSFDCAQLGFASTDCDSVRDENNNPVVFPVEVPARNMKRFYLHSATWSN